MKYKHRMEVAQTDVIGIELTRARTINPGIRAEKQEVASMTSMVESGHFEEVIDLLGTFGHWQRVVFFMLCLPDLLGAFAMMVPVFAGATPNWHCLMYRSENTTLESVHWCNGSMVNQTGDEMKCGFHEWKCTKFAFQNDFSSIVSEWNLVCDDRYLISLISSIQMIGLALGAGLFGYLADWFGRKKCYFTSVSLMIIGGISSGFTPSWALYALTRFIVGFGFGSYMVVNCTYPLEFVGPRWRTLCGTIGFWAIGVMILAIFGYLIRDWRTLVMVTSAIGVVFLPFWLVIPESPRWLLQRGYVEEAHVIIDKIAKKNKKETPAKDLLMTIAEQSNQTEAAERMFTYLDLFRSKDYAKRTVIMICFWFYGFIAYYTLSYNLRTMSGNRYLNMFLGGLVDLPAMVSVIFLNSWLGRRGALVFYTSITVITALCVIGIFGHGELNSPPDTDISEFIPGYSEMELGFALVGRAAGLAITYVVQIYTAELYATVVRNLGLGACAVSGRIGGIVAPQMVYLGTIFTLGPYIMSAGIGLLIIGLAFLLPETRGEPLDELPPGFERKMSNNSK